MNPIFASILGMGLLGLFAGALLAYSDQKFKREVDPRLKEIEEALPKANCGACGFAGCAGFAEAVFTSKADYHGCLLGGADTAGKLANILGVTLCEKERLIAALKCGGGIAESVNRFDYDGQKTCAAAQALGGGFKACVYGCLGFGDCEKACPVKCIKMNANGLPVVDREKCIGCGKCNAACPRKLFALLPCDVQYSVNCSSTDPGAAVRKVCKVGCITCKLCDKKTPAKVSAAFPRCPVKCIVKLS